MVSMMDGSDGGFTIEDYLDEDDDDEEEKQQQQQQPQPWTWGSSRGAEVRKGKLSAYRIT